MRERRMPVMKPDCRQRGSAVWRASAFVVGFLVATTSGCAPKPLALSHQQRLEPATLRIGDRAPALVISEWIGTAPAEAPVTVISFWAPWCAPCHAAMPKLLAVAGRHAGTVSVIAVASADSYAGVGAIRRTAAELPTAPSFVVAVDRGMKSATRHRVAVRDTALPRCFIVDRDARLAWFGHPAELDSVIDSVVAGTWNLADARDDHERRDANRVRSIRALDRYWPAARAGDTDTMRAALEELVTMPVDEIDGISPTHWPWWALVDLLGADGELDGARAVAIQAIELDGIRGDPWAVSLLASTLHRWSPDDALPLAERALAVLERIDRDGAPDDPWEAWLHDARRTERGAAWATVASILSAAGDHDRAIAAQERAVELSPEDPRFIGNRSQQQAALERYRERARRALGIPHPRDPP